MAECEHLSATDWDKVLIEAVGGGHERCLKSSIEAGADVNIPVSKLDKYSTTALIKAATKDHVNCVRLLIEAAADVNASNYYDKIALRCASANGHEECVRVLIEAGADVNVSTVEALKKYRTTPLIVAAINGHVNCVKLLIEAGADVNGINNDGETVLKCAAEKGQVECVKQLLKAGADVNASDAYAQEFLKSNKEDSYLSGRFAGNPYLHYTVLMCVAYRGHVDCVKGLINAGADVNATSGDVLDMWIVLKP